MGFMKFDAIPEAKYLCDTIEDLSTLLPRPSYGDTCWVISEACEYICNSKGEWLPKEKASKTTADVDLTGYATETFVQEQIQNIEHPTVEVPSKLSELENDANYAQQAYVDTKVADLVNSAPETLDTIGEIAQALKEHQDVADAITEAIGKKADKEDLPSIEGLASEAFVTEAIQKIEFPVTDLSNYYTKDEVTQAITPELSFKIVYYPDFDNILASEKTFEEVDEFAYKHGLNNLNLSLFIAGTTLYNEEEGKNPYYYAISCDKVRGIAEEETIAYDFTFIVDQEKRVYRLDKNGVSLVSTSKDIPETTEPNQYLTTNENSEKVWEEKLAYYAKEEKLLIPEQVVDANNAYVLHSNFEAQTGDVCRVILDEKTYTGVYQNAGNGMLAAIQMTEGEGFPVNRFFTHFSDYGVQMAPLGFSGTLTVYVTTSVVHPIKPEYLGIPVMSGDDTYAVKIGNCDKSKVKGFSAIALNEAQALMPCALGINEGIAEGWHSFAQGTGRAKDMCSSAFGVGTVSAGYAQMVSGKNNLEDLNSDYAVIVGNGEAGYDENDEYYVNHANAHTLDWQGNARFAGDVYVQGTDVDDLQDAKKVATEEYVNSLVQDKADSADVVQADWDENNSESNAYVMNRPFYDSRTNVIEWDGETSDTIITIPRMNVTLYRVSDTPLTKAELGTVTYYEFGGTKGSTDLNSDLSETTDKKIVHASQTFSFVSVLEDGAVLHIGSGVEDVVFEKKGIYFWELKFSATMSFKTQKIRYGAVTPIPDYYISNRIARQDTVQWIDYSTPKTFLIYATYLDKDIITEVHPGGYIAGSGKNYTNDLADALSYDDIKLYFNYAPNWAKTINIAWHPSEDVLEKRQALDLHLGEDGIGFHFIKDITFDETTGQPKFNLKKVWIANPNYVAE